jgi:hypothetical protein
MAFVSGPNDSNLVRKCDIVHKNVSNVEGGVKEKVNKSLQSKRVSCDIIFTVNMQRNDDDYTDKYGNYISAYAMWERT